MTVLRSVLLRAIWYGPDPITVPLVVVQVELSVADEDMDARDAVQALSRGHRVPTCRGNIDSSVSSMTRDCIAVQIKGCSVGVAVADSLRLMVHERSDDFFGNLSHDSVVLLSGLSFISTKVGNNSQRFKHLFK